MARRGTGPQNGKGAPLVLMGGEPRGDLKQERGEPPSSGLRRCVSPLCFASGLISVPCNCLKGGWSNWLQS